MSQEVPIVNWTIKFLTLISTDTQKNVCLNQTTKLVWYDIIERNKFFALIKKTLIFILIYGKYLLFWLKQIIYLIQLSSFKQSICFY